jgi:hypothetical protein
MPAACDNPSHAEKNPTLHGAGSRQGPCQGFLPRCMTLIFESLTPPPLCGAGFQCGSECWVPGTFRDLTINVPNVIAVSKCCLPMSTGCCMVLQCVL